MPSDRELKTVGYYDKSAVDWVSSHGGNKKELYWRSQLDKLRELVPSGRVLEIGSGAGKDASALIEMGYDYTGTDASSGLIEIAKAKNPGAKFVNVSVENLDFPEKSFDCFWAAAVLLHIPKDHIDTALTSIKSQILDGGVGVITLKKGEGEKEDSSTGRWFAYYKEDEFKEVLSRNGFETIEVEEKADDREGRPDWLIFFVRT